jgi:hypothetical protein
MYSENDGIPIPTIGTPSTYVCMLGRRLHLGLDVTSVSDILSFISRPKGNLDKHLVMILLDIDKELTSVFDVSEYKSLRLQYNH